MLLCDKLQILASSEAGTFLTQAGGGVSDVDFSPSQPGMEENASPLPN